MLWRQNKHTVEATGLHGSLLLITAYVTETVQAVVHTHADDRRTETS